MTKRDKQALTALWTTMLVLAGVAAYANGFGFPGPQGSASGGGGGSGVNPSTDNGIPRFDGIAGALQDSGVTITDGASPKLNVATGNTLYTSVNGTAVGGWDASTVYHYQPVRIDTGNICHLTNATANAGLRVTSGGASLPASITVTDTDDTTEIAWIGSQGVTADSYVCGVAALSSATSMPMNTGSEQITTLTISQNMTGNATFSIDETDLRSTKSFSKTVIVTGGAGGPYTVQFDADWKWLNTEPTSIGANAVVVFSLTTYGSDPGNVLVSWVVTS